MVLCKVAAPQSTNSLHQGKVNELDLAETDKSRAEATIKSMCEKLLANTVIENYAIEIRG
ncbi:MAG TPA: phosphoribosylformylglycinamidine synthase subunit PurS [Stellaceae bacterium]|nr:phosphoribosylformylglycinamidine synthase subunit PurS [Stellaceae bacterium]